MAKKINTVTTVDSDSINTSYSAISTSFVQNESLNSFLNRKSPSSSVSSSSNFSTQQSSSPVTPKKIVLLSTLTDTTVLIPDLDIYTYYIEEGIPPFIFNIFISDNSGLYLGVPYKEGELLAKYDENEIDSLVLDSNGNLIVTSDDSANYSIDSDGNLIYTI